jgi:hypothetical protein
VTSYLDDPRLERAEATWFEAEQADKRGEGPLARAHYAKASDLYGEVAFEVPHEPHFREIRGVWAIAAVSMAAKARMFERAVELAERFLSDVDTLIDRDRAQLVRMLYAYRPVRQTTSVVVVKPNDPLATWRAEIRRAA